MSITAAEASGIAGNILATFTDVEKEVIFDFTTEDGTEYTFTRVNGVDTLYFDDEMQAQWINETRQDLETWLSANGDFTPFQRLNYLRDQINQECISYGEIAELQSLAKYIEPWDVQLLEWAGVPEHPETD